jgi:D-alanine-D-alanine ligase
MDYRILFMKIGFTYDLKSDHSVAKDLPDDVLAELDREETILEIEQAIESGGYKVVRIGHVRNLLERVRGELNVDIIFNICEGLRTRNRESEVPIILDIFKLPYVGSDGLTMGLTLDKAMAKKAFVADRVPTPKYFVASPKDINIGSMKFPLIVKPKHEGSSKGISQDSVVRNEKELKAQVSEIAALYKQDALVEEFISGTEFTVLVIGNKTPVAFEPVQIGVCGNVELGDIVYTSRHVTTDEIVYICPAKISKKLKEKIMRIAVLAYKSVDCRDFGRVDFRVDKKGNPYVLEINPLPSLSTDDVFPLIAKAHKSTYNEFILKIIDAALGRCNL